jgi:hypothetical protein
MACMISRVALQDCVDMLYATTCAMDLLQVQLHGLTTKSTIQGLRRLSAEKSTLRLCKLSDTHFDCCHGVRVLNVDVKIPKVQCSVKNF